MVFRSTIGSEVRTPTPPSPKHRTESVGASTLFNSDAAAAAMASSNAKPPHQPLHNFPLQGLRWSLNQTPPPRVRKSAFAAADQPRPMTPHCPAPTSVSHPARPSGSVPSPSPKVETTDKVSGKSVGEGSRKETGFRFRIPAKPALEKSPAVPAAAAAAAVVAADRSSAVAADDSVLKSWNLRPRNPIKKNQSSNSNGGALRVGVGGPLVPCQERAARAGLGELESDAQGGSKKGKGKRKLKGNEPLVPNMSIQLSSDEVEVDFYCMVGARPSRRPKKRAKNVQRNLDAVFPGMYLSSLTADCYRVVEPSAKKKKSYDSSEDSES